MIILYHYAGTSDPYVKFKLGNNEIGRSQIIKKNLDPIWDEEFNINIENVRAVGPLLVEVNIY